jgi:hypothetical protein
MNLSKEVLLTIRDTYKSYLSDELKYRKQLEAKIR